MATAAEDQNGLRDTRFGLDPNEVLRAMSQRKWLILASTIVVGAAVAAGTMRQRKVYSAQASILLEPVLPKVLENPVGFEGVSELGHQELVFSNTQYQIMKSNQVLLATAAALKLDQDAGYLEAHGLRNLKSEELLDAIAKSLAGQLQIEPQRGSRIVRLIVEDYEPKRAADIANEIVRAYRTFTLDKRLGATLEAQQWLDQQVAEFAKRLSQSQDGLNQFRFEHKLSLEDRKAINSAKLARLDEELVGVRTSLIRLRAKRTILKNELALKGGAGAAVPEISSNTVVVSLKASLLDLQSRRAQLQGRYGPKHEALKAIEDQIAEVERLITNELSIVVETANNEIAALENTEAGVNAALEVERATASELDKLFAQYSQLVSDHDMLKTRYDSLLRRQTDADLSGRLKSNFVEIFESAEVRPHPVRPSMIKNSALGILAGLLLGILITIAGVLLDTTVRSQSDLEEGLGLTFLGIVPSIQAAGGGDTSRNGPGSRDLYIVQNPKSSLAECVRSIRTNILFMGTDRPLKKILVTSPGPSEGKSTIATNLAIVMAQAGHRVLLVDTDLRRPRLHRAFGFSSEVGLTSVLLRAASLADAVRSTEVPGLEILPCGPLPPNPAELLHSSHFTKLVSELEATYDRVIFDSPPVNAVTDAVILSQTADGTVLVAKVAATAKDGIRRARRQLVGVKAQLLGCVLNDVDLDSGAYAYSYYYYNRRYAYGAEEKGAQV